MTTRTPLSLCCLLLAAGLLTSCAALRQEPPRSEPEAAPPSPPAAQAQPGAAAAGAPQPQAAQPQDPGINRDGQVIQLGRFSEQAPAVDPPANDVVELNYEQEDLRLVLQELGDALDLNMVIDPTIDERVSLRTSPDNPLQFADIWPLMRLLAANAGVTIERAGDLVEFRSDGSTVPSEILMPQFLDQAESANVLQVTPLTYISYDAAQEILAPMLQPEGRIIRLGPTNLMGISGTPSQLSRINAMLDVIDTDPFQAQGIRLYQLNFSPAAEVAEELQNVLRLIGGEQSSYQVLPLERINSVLVTAPAQRGFDEVTRWVQVLDAQDQGQEEQLFVYRVKSLNAPNLARTLMQVFDQDENSPLADDNDPARDGRGDLPGSPSFGGQDAEDEEEPEFQPERVDGGGDSGGNEIVSANLSVTIVADEDTNTLLIRATPREYRQLLTTISSLDSLPRQVLINAVIGQVTLNEGNEFGVDWTRVSANAASGPAQLSTRFLPAGDVFNEAGEVIAGSGLVFTRTFMDGAAIIDATLRAISQDNEVTLLARPSITVTNNQEGEMKVGQSVPINLGSNIIGQGVVSQNINYQDVGIELRITPHINDEGFVNMEIFQSLSSIEPGLEGVNDNPVFSNQEITTRAVVSNESTIILGGLIQDEESTNNSGVPGLQDIPLFGALFSYQEYQNSRRELFVILRPQIIDESERAARFREFRDRFEHLGQLMEEAGL